MPEGLKVRKREGGEESWSYDKLLASINKAGVPVEDSERKAKEVEGWALQNAKGGVITSVELRNKVIESLKVDFPAEADSYQAFKKG